MEDEGPDLPLSQIVRRIDGSLIEEDEPLIPVSLHTFGQLEVVFVCRLRDIFVKQPVQALLKLETRYLILVTGEFLATPLEPDSLFDQLYGIFRKLLVFVFRLKRFEFLERLQEMSKAFGLFVWQRQVGQEAVRLKNTFKFRSEKLQNNSVTTALVHDVTSRVQIGKDPSPSALILHAPPRLVGADPR